MGIRGLLRLIRQNTSTKLSVKAEGRRLTVVLVMCSSAFILFSHDCLSQTSADAALQLSALVQNNPPQITLNWTGNASTTQYQVYRKLKTGVSWGSPVATLNGTTNVYVDNTVSNAVSYEYYVRRFGSGYNGYGYINAGIEIPETDFRGTLILIVDSTFIQPLSSEISRLIEDIEGDGWNVIRHDVLRTGSVTHVKSLIVNDYQLDPVHTKAVFLLGHVPVPYSGNINPDGHANHIGAWPADVYYGDVNGLWTDVSVTSTTNSPARTQNIPGDGKFDQSLVPGDVELQVGRVDFDKLPAFSDTEEQLLKKYLNKDHEYRKKIFTAQKKAVIDDNFGYFGSEAFAASGYKNFSPLVGPSNVSTGDYFTDMGTSDYLWSYGCGGGSYTSASGIGNTTNFTTSNLQGVFTMLFGSYFGDWDINNNFLRAPLAQGRILTNVWSGRPHYQFHHMGLGENIGYSLLITQNNPGGMYFSPNTGITGKWIHNALMGDPTLRNDVVAPVSNVVATKSGFHCHINWTASADTMIAGYNIYMKNNSANSFVKLNAGPVTSTSYTHECLEHIGIYKYMVRTLKLENTPSGTYYNLSESISDTANNTSGYNTFAAFAFAVNGNSVSFTNISTNATTYHWDFGNGLTDSGANPSAVYDSNGDFIVMLVAQNECDSDTMYQVVSISGVGIQESTLVSKIGIYPNPAHGEVILRYDDPGNIEYIISDQTGREVYRGTAVTGENHISLDQLSRGLYYIHISGEGSSVVKKIMIE